MTTWRDKARDIIARVCRESYRQANIMPNGKKRRNHVPYSIPEIATALIAALDADDEYEAKRLFIVEATGALTLI